MDHDVYRIFGCGIDYRAFKNAYEASSEETKSLLRRVAWRVWFTLKLDYEVAFRSHPFVANDSYELTRFEIPSLKVYLLVTCLDTFAGQEYQQFPKWLKQQLPDGPRKKLLDLFLLLSLTIKEWLSNNRYDGFLALYEQWRQDHGPRKKLRDLFLRLPLTVKEWLSNNIVIQRANKEFDPENIELESDVLVTRLFKYFYDLRRNEYTHRGITRHTSRTEHIGLLDEWQISLFSGYEFDFGDGRTWTLNYRKDLDEATILRIIIQSVGLQIMGLDAELSEEVIKVQLASYSRLEAVYRFLNEVESNAHLLSLWSKFEENEQFRSYLSEAEMPSLQTEWSVALIEHFRYPPERHWQATIAQYQRYVNHLNHSIDNFNAANPVSQANQDYRLQTVKQFFEAQVSTSDYKLVLEMPSRNEAINLGLYINHPCPPQLTIRIVDRGDEGQDE